MRVVAVDGEEMARGNGSQEQDKKSGIPSCPGLSKPRRMNHIRPSWQVRPDCDPENDDLPYQIDDTETLTHKQGCARSRTGARHSQNNKCVGRG